MKTEREREREKDATRGNADTVRAMELKHGGCREQWFGRDGERSQVPY
jgi:hypothetical protein